MKTSRNLSTIHRKLLEHYGATEDPMPDDPFHLILWEQVAYLADDDKRRDAFQRLARKVGLSPQDIVRADFELLTEIAESGGAIAGRKRADRMQESARLALSKWGGDLRRVLRLPVDQALRALTKFPMIGRPGAEKILVFTGAAPILALESNGLRVLLRLGYGEEDRRYEKTYESVRKATEQEERADCHWLMTLHSLLRKHGQEVCRRSRPQCSMCPLTRECDYYEKHSRV